MINVSDLSILEIQKRILQMYQDRGFDKASPTTLALGACEEVGELAQAVLITSTPDFTPSEKKLSAEWSDCRDVASEAGDCITYILALCNKLGIQPSFKWLSQKAVTDQ